MKLCSAFIPFILVGTSLAQETAPVILSPGGSVAICHGKADDASDCVTPPHATYSPDPKYPEKARRAKQRGDVILQLIVGADGLPRDVKVDRGLTPELDQAALDAVNRWKFAPAAREGHPVSAQIKVEVSFHLY
ncbi:MAG: hypothetical protein DMG80_02235 [Acidobacteria bacterium]|nr:MAG: hypothetical protein DMG80_02235 [Acidobacteriota bacterium]